jgi:uncharacterized protein YkwD
MKNKPRALAIVFAIASCCISLNEQTSAQSKSFAYRTSSAQSFSSTLGASVVPAYVLVGKVPHQGIFIVSAPTADAGRKMNLSPGVVLLTIDNYSMISAQAVDNWLSHRSKRGPITFTYATDNDGQPQMHTGSAQVDIASAGSSGGTSSGTSSGTTSGTTLGSASGASRSPSQNRNPASMPAGGSSSSVMLALLNKSRAEGGLSPLALDATLSRFAQSYADYLGSNATKYDVRDAKNNPHADLNGRGPVERAQQAGISNFLNENIGRNIGNMGIYGVKVLHEQMMGSAGHRPAIMDPEAHLVGIGSTQVGNRLFLVEEFGR